MQRAVVPILLLPLVVIVAVYAVWPAGDREEAVAAEPAARRAAEDTGVELRSVASEPSDRDAAVDRRVEVGEAAPAPARNVVTWLRNVKPDELGELTDEQLAALTELDLRGADITDEDLWLIGQLTNLTRLSLYGTPVTDAGLVHLAGLTNLEFVVLRGTQVTGVGLQHLPTANLTDLHLCRSQITPEDLQHTPVMPKLKTLKLNFLGLEDDVVEQLNVYPALKHIELDESALTDKGLARLLELNPGLGRIELRNTKVSSEGVAELAKRYPDCEFVSDQGQGLRPPHPGR